MLLSQESQSLASKMKQNKVTDKGIAMLEKIGYMFDEDDNDKLVFLQQVLLFC